jgi:hypothetical protein
MYCTDEMLSSVAEQNLEFGTEFLAHIIRTHLDMAMYNLGQSVQ